ncbi:MAG: serine/threonine protein kinase [Myxococcales bacterium]|nr:serine/threonine protein kinase [Myxococcales bacterium]
MDRLIGQMIAGRYFILDRVGEGGMGTVYRARQEPVGRLVAVKVLLPALVSEQRQLQRFMNEARIMSSLRHPNTVKLVDFGHLEGGRLFIAMEFLHGGTLEDRLKGGRLTQVAALRITRQILAALNEAHAHGIVHRDLKPTNVLFDEVAGEQFVVRVADFGLARFDPMLAGSEPLEPGERPSGRYGIQQIGTIPGTRLGTPAYISPEQAFGKPIDARSDLYAVGILLYEMLTGLRPFESDTEHGLYLAHLHDTVKPINAVSASLGIDPAVEAIVARMMAKLPEDRPPNAEAVIRVIDDVLSRLAPTHKPISGLITLPPVERDEEDDEPMVIARSGPPGWVWALLVGGLLVVAALFAVR